MQVLAQVAECCAMWCTLSTPVMRTAVHLMAVNGADCAIHIDNNMKGYLSAGSPLLMSRYEAEPPLHKRLPSGARVPSDQATTRTAKTEQAGITASESRMLAPQSLSTRTRAAHGYSRDLLTAGLGAYASAPIPSPSSKLCVRSCFAVAAGARSLSSLRALRPSPTGSAASRAAKSAAPGGCNGADDDAGMQPAPGCCGCGCCRGGFPGLCGTPTSRFSDFKRPARGGHDRRQTWCVVLEPGLVRRRLPRSSVLLHAPQSYMLTIRGR